MNWRDGVSVDGAEQQKSPTVRVSDVSSFSGRSSEELTHEDELAILSHTGEAVSSTFSPSWIKGDRGDKRRVTLTAGDYA